MNDQHGLTKPGVAPSMLAHPYVLIQASGTLVTAPGAGALLGDASAHAPGTGRGNSSDTGPLASSESDKGLWPNGSAWRSVFR
jgi:hypothetical protein